MHLRSAALMFIACLPLLTAADPWRTRPDNSAGWCRMSPAERVERQRRAQLYAWVGCAALVVSFALLVSEPRWAAAFGGLEHLCRWHHRSGALAYLALLLHPLALAREGSGESAAVAWQVLAPWPNDPAVQVGWLALLALVAGMATSFAAKLR